MPTKSSRHDYHMIQPSTHSWVHSAVIESRASNRTLALYTSILISIDKSQKTENKPNAHRQMSRSTKAYALIPKVNLVMYQTIGET